MKHMYLLCATLLLILSCTTKKNSEEWIPLFNGKDLSGWKWNEHEETFRVENGILITNGERSHLFYEGEEGNASFTNFELKADIMTTHGSNSGIFFNTTWQDEGWPEKGYEAQVNTSHAGGGGYKEVKKTGSLYGVRNVYKALSEDSTWFTMRIRVEGKHVNIWVNDIMTVDYIEPLDSENDLRKAGTIAIQGHDPGSTVYFKDIMIKELSDASTSLVIPNEDAYPEILSLQENHFPFIDMGIPMTSEEASEAILTSFYESGINIGYSLEIPSMEELNAKWQSFTHLTDEKPAFIGVTYPLDDSSVLGTNQLGSLDFRIGAMPAYDDSPVLNIDEFIEKHINQVERYLEKNPIDIIQNATMLPHHLMEGYDALWTKDRMKALIDRLKNKNVAIGVDCQTHYPSLDFIKLAKENGCTFSFHHLIDERGNAHLEYILKAIEFAELGYKDVFIPGNM